MYNLRKLMTALVLMLLVICSVGCGEKGSAEKAGEQLDKTMDDAAKKANEFMGKYKCAFYSMSLSSTLFKKWLTRRL